MKKSHLFLVLAMAISPWIIGRTLLNRTTFWLNDKCVQQFSSPTTPELTHQLGSALICGRSLPSGPLRSLFIDLGLYHVLVVSGSHLALITATLMFLFSPSSQVALPLLWIYSLATGLQAPVLRALFEWSLRTPERPSWISQVLAVALCLVFQPDWVNSRSLFLSALARQCLAPANNPFWTALKIQFFLWPLLWDLQNPTVLSLVASTSLAFLIELVLFPILALYFLFPFLTFEPLLQILVTLLQEIQSLFAGTRMALPLKPPQPIIIYWLMVFCLLQWFEQKKLRSWYFSK